MSISFQEIPNDIRVPGAYAEIDPRLAARGLPGIPSRILVLGQMLASGTAAAGVPVQVLDARQAEALFGRASMLHRIFVALKGNNSWTETWAIPLADAGAGVAATKTITFGGTVTLAGTLSLYIGGRRVRVAVTTSDAPDDVAAAVASAVNADTLMPVTAAAALAVVTLTARHKGENGQAIDVRANYYGDEGLPPGLTVAVAAGTPGSGNPDVATAIAAMGDEWWTDVVMPWTDAANMTALETELADRFTALEAKGAHAWAALAGTHGTLTTWSSSRNSPFVTAIGAKASPTPPEEWAAALAGQAAYALKLDPARPLTTLPLEGVLPPARADRFTLAERNLLLFAGVATFTVDAGGVVRIERPVTGYQTNAQGVDDPTWLDCQTPKLATYVRYAVTTRMLQRYPRHKLADDGTRFGAGQDVATPKTIRGELVALGRELEDAGLIENGEQLATIVERAGYDPNRVDSLLSPDFVNGLLVFAARIQFLV